MHTLNVSPDTPLTNQKHAVECFVVSDQDGPGGVYYSLERACQYITDWLRAGELPIDDRHPRQTAPASWAFCGYTIDKTYLRI